MSAVLATSELALGWRKSKLISNALIMSSISNSIAVMFSSRASIHLLLVTLLLFSQWVSADHAVELSDDIHVHSIDCSVCTFDNLAQAIPATVTAVPIEGRCSLAMPSSAAFYALHCRQFKAIRAPPVT